MVMFLRFQFVKLLGLWKTARKKRFNQITWTNEKENRPLCMTNKFKL